MTEQQELDLGSDDQPSKVIWSKRMSFEYAGEECEVNCYLLEDRGAIWVFKRGAQKFPVRLSAKAMECMTALWQRAMWMEPADLHPGGNPHGQS